MYGLSLAQYEALLVAQDNRCALCSKDEPGGRHGVWHVDHDHETGVVRGLLCDGCNRAMGFFGHNVKVMRAAIEYLNP